MSKNNKSISLRAPQLLFDIDGAQLKGKRAKQEDHLKHGPLGSRAMGIVADGVGGNPCGHIASKLAATKAWEMLVAVPNMQNISELASAIGQSFWSAHHTVLEAPQQSKGCERMATTMVTIVADGTHKAAWFCSVGDSHVLQLKNGSLIDAISEDEPMNWGRGTGFLSTAIGLRLPDAGPLVMGARIKAGDRFLLASDGLETLPLETASEIIRDAATASDAVKELLKAVKRCRADFQDNASVIALFVNKKE